MKMSAGPVDVVMIACVRTTLVGLTANAKPQLISKSMFMKTANVSFVVMFNKNEHY